MNPRKLVSEVRNLSAPSPAIVQLVSLLNSPDADNEKILKLVKCDGVLCGRLLAMCNSAAAALSQPVGSVEQAVFHVGYQKIYQHVLSLSFGPALGRRIPAYSIEDQELWRHSLLTAMISESIQKACQKVSIEASVAYTAGLLHDIGKLVLCHHISEYHVTAIQEAIESDRMTRIEAERSVLKTDHAEVGACLMESWRLPETIIEAVAHHHEPITTPAPGASVLVHLANTLAHELGSAPGWGSHALRTDPVALDAIGCSQDKIENLLLAAYGSLQRMEVAASQS